MSKILANVVKLWGKYWLVFLRGTGKTLELSVVTVFFGLILGAFLALMKMSRMRVGKIRPLNILATAYVEVIRGTPLLLQLYFFYFFLPSALPFLNISKTGSILIALVANSAGYVAEIIRAGIDAVDIGQTEAARSLGLNARKTMVKVVLPQAVKNILPALGNELIMMIKETALAANFFVGEIMTQYQIISGATFLNIECLIIVGLIYLVLTLGLGKIMSIFEGRLKASD